MSCSVLHHVEICVKDDSILDLLTHGFGFNHFARRFTRRATQWVLKSGGCVFVVTKRRDGEEANGKGIGNEVENGENRKRMNGMQEDFQDEEEWTVFCCRDAASHEIDSVFNVSLVVRDVDSVTQKVRAMGGRVLKEPRDLSDSRGKVRYAIVTSCCGNIVHTLINKKDYHGGFLPGFEEVDHEAARSSNEAHISNGFYMPNGDISDAQDLKNDQNPNKEIEIHGESLHSPLPTHIDHVTYVCRAGESKGLLDWYEKCFGMKRFLANSEESEADGFVLGDNIGLRLKAMEYWKCAETGLLSPGSSMEDSSLKLVIAEPLPDVSTSHVETFLRAHKGPGVQHIGLHTPTMTSTVAFMAKRGIVFRKPPPVYYQEGVKLGEIEEAGHGEEISLFRELGILLDTEADIFTEMESEEDKKRYLMQVFTSPIFKEDTFFLEVIQRCGARGFGAGNITALARSIILYNEQQQKSQS